MADLKKNEWLLRNNNSMFSEKTLPTPGVLNTTSNTLQMQFSATMDAFHKATREGFRLQDVNKAPLAQRRKKKKASDERSSTDSSQSGGSVPQGSQSSSGGAHLISLSPRDSPVRNLSTNSNISNTSSTSHSSTHSLGFVPLRTTPVGLGSSQNTTGFNTSDVCVIEPSTSVDNIAYQEILSSDSENSVTDDPPFQKMRGVKRKHSLEEDYSDLDDDSEEENDDNDKLTDDESDNSDCIIIDDEDDGESESYSSDESISELQNKKKITRSNKKCRKESTIIIDD